MYTGLIVVLAAIAVAVVALMFFVRREGDVSRGTTADTGSSGDIFSNSPMMSSSDFSSSPSDDAACEVSDSSGWDSSDSDCGSDSGGSD